MFIGLGMPIPDLSNKPGPGRPGWGPSGSYDFQFEVAAGQVGITVLPRINGLRFTVKWQDGTEQAITSDQTDLQSPTTQAGIISINNEELDTTWCDDFKITSGQSLVTKVISWGQNPWNKLSSAFSYCTNLTDISKTSLITDGVGNCDAIFRGCTSLLEIDAKNWQVSSGWKAAYFAEGCTNLTKIDMTGLSMKIGRSDNWMQNVGTNVADGCEFLMSGISFISGSGSSTYNPYWFRNSKMKNTSTFASWSWDNGFTDWYGINMFDNIDFLGTDSTLDISGWSTFPGTTLSGYIRSINYTNGAVNNNLTIDLTGLNVSNVNSFTSFSQTSDVYKIKGISTWGATAGNVNMQRMFESCKLLKIPTSDNFSDTFIQSLTPTNLYAAFQQVGLNLPESDLEAAINLNGFDVSNCTSFTNTWYYYHSGNSLDFSNVTFGSTAHNFTRTWSGAYAHESNSTLNFPNQLVASIFSSAFQGAVYDNITFGNNVDFSQVTSIDNMLASQKSGVNITFPTVASGLSFASLSSTGNWFAGTTGPTTGPLTTCQVDNLIRSFYNTALNSGLSVNFGTSQITESPSVVSTMVDELENTGGWNITPNTLDGTMPFAYASYAVDPTGITTISPTTTPPAGSVFTATNSLSINSSTGVITINTFRGGSTIRCTYPDGCYNEVVMLIQVPFQVDVTINSSTSYVWGFNPQMSAGECLVDWGDSSSETVTGNITHTYANTGGDATYSVKIFDAPSGSKFTGFNAWNNTYINNGGNLIDIKKWGDIQWQNNTWFSNDLNISPYYLQLQVSCASNDAPDLSQVTSLNSMFRVGSNRFNYAFTDPNNSLASWNVSTITDMAHMFAGIGKNGSVTDNGNFDTNLNSWDVSSVTDMSSLAALNRGYSQNRVDFFCDQWDVSKVESFNRTFYSASGGTVVNRDLSNWNTSSATDMAQMFYNNTPGPNTNLLYKVVNAGQASEYKAWDVSNVTSFTSTFYGGKLGTQGIYNWKINSTAGVNVNMASMFQTCPDLDAFVQTDADHINTKQETVGSETYTAWNMSRVSSLSNFNYNGYTTPYNPDLSGWSLGNVTTMSGMFYDSNPYIANPVLNRDISNWKPISVANMTNFYRNAQKSPIAMDRSNYDLLLDIANGWGSVASSMQSGVAFDMGTSQYTGNNAVIGTTTVNGTSTNLVAGGNPFTSSMVGGIVTITSGTNNGQQAKITAFNSAGSVTISRAINIVSPPNTFTIDTTDAVKGRFALSDPDGPGWIITDGGKEVPFDPFKLQVRVPANSSLAFSFAKIMSPSNVNATLKWGDGQESTINTVNSIPTHTYTNNTGSDVDYELELNQGSDSVYCTGFRFDDNLDATSRAAVRNLTQWGSTSWVSMASAFRTCSNFDITATDGPVITSSTSLTHTFGYCTSLVNSNGSIGNWDVSQLTGMYVTFDGCTSFNVDISKWDTSSLGNINRTFVGCTSFNQDLSTKYITAGNSPTGSAYWAWKTNSITTIQQAFLNATSFNCGNNANGLSNWDTSIMTNFQETFMNTSYNKPLNTNLVPAASSYSGSDYVAWDVQNCINFGQMFRDNTSFNQDVGKWRFKETSNFVMNYVFKGATAFAQDISTKTITASNSPYGTQYTAWDMRKATTLTRIIAGTNVNVFLNWGTGPWSTYSLHSWGGASAAGGLSVANYTDQIVKWANDVNAAGKTPTGIFASINGDGATAPNYDSTRTYGSGFANAGRARSYLSLDVTVSGSGDSSINGVYYYDYANAKWVRENDANIQIAWNGDESVWEVSVEGEATNSGSGGSQAGGPTSVTSWSGGIAVADSSAGWTFNGTVTT